MFWVNEGVIRSLRAEGTKNVKIFRLINREHLSMSSYHNIFFDVASCLRNLNAECFNVSKITGARFKNEPFQ